MREYGKRGVALLRSLVPNVTGKTRKSIRYEATKKTLTFLSRPFLSRTLSRPATCFKNRRGFKNVYSQQFDNEIIKPLTEDIAKEKGRAISKYMKASLERKFNPQDFEPESADDEINRMLRDSLKHQGL